MRRHRAPSTTAPWRDSVARPHVMARRGFTLLLASMPLLVSSLAHAGGAEEFVKQKQAELTALLKQGQSAEVERKIAAIFDAMLDYDSLAKESLKNYWDDRSEEERKEFKSVLQQLVQRAYKANLRKTLDYEVSYKGTSQTGGATLVATVAKNKSNRREEPIHVDYALHTVAGGWRVRDIVTEGSSLVNNYRNQFRRIIDEHGFKELLKRMKDKLKGG